MKSLIEIINEAAKNKVNLNDLSKYIYVVTKKRFTNGIVDDNLDYWKKLHGNGRVCRFKTNDDQWVWVSDIESLKGLFDKKGAAFRRDPEILIFSGDLLDEKLILDTQKIQSKDPYNTVDLDNISKDDIMKLDQYSPKAIRKALDVE